MQKIYLDGKETSFLIVKGRYKDLVLWLGFRFIGAYQDLTSLKTDVINGLADNNIKFATLEIK